MFLLIAGILYKLIFAAIFCFVGYKMYTTEETRAGKNTVYRKKWVFAAFIIFSLLIVKNGISEVIRLSKSQSTTAISTIEEKLETKGIVANNETVYRSTGGWMVSIPVGFRHYISEADGILTAKKKDSVFVISQQISNLKLNEFVANKLKYMKSKKPSAIIISEEEIIKDVFNGIRVSFEYGDNSFGKTSGIWVFYKKDNLYFELLLTCLKENINRYAPIFEKIIHSFNS